MKLLTDQQMEALTHEIADVLDNHLQTQVNRINLDEHLRVMFHIFEYAKTEGGSLEELESCGVSELSEAEQRAEAWDVPGVRASSMPD